MHAMKAKKRIFRSFFLKWQIFLTVALIGPVLQPKIIMDAGLV
jgi:hypothetical protein